MKVAHLVSSFIEDGGPGDELVDLAAVSGTTGVEPVVVVLGSSGDRWEVSRLRRLGVPVVELGLAPWDPRAVRRTARVLREHGVDLVHTHRRNADVIGGLATRLGRGPALPLVSTLYTVENLPTNPADRLRRTAKILLRRRVAARTVAISHLQRERYRRFSGTDRGLVIVPNGIADPGLVSADERARVRSARGVADDGILAVSAAPMRRGQGQDLLLDAVSAVPPSVPLTVVLLGDGPLRPWLVSRVESDEVLAARVHFEPRAPHDPARDVIGAADLFLHTARSGALPLPLIRARRAGRSPRGLARRRRPGDRDARHGAARAAGRRLDRGRRRAARVGPRAAGAAGEGCAGALPRDVRGQGLGGAAARGLRRGARAGPGRAGVAARGSGPATLPPTFFDAR